MNFKGVFFNSNDFELIDKEIGSGAFGKVYLIESIKDNKKYAAKIINIEEGFSGDDQMKFLQESIILHQLHHPSIVQFIGINFQSLDDVGALSPTIITEYIPNGSLKKILNDEKNFNADHKWTPTKKYISLIGIANAMRYLHKQGILHRDLKPENILMDKDYNPHICDFGLSKCFPKSLSKSIKMTITRNIGTPIYMPPEMISENEEEKAVNYAYAVDVYSFAMIAYEMITGKQPFSEIKNLTFFGLCRKILDGYRPPLTDQIPPKMKELITQCWSGDIKERPSFDEIFEKLSSDFSYFDEDVDAEEIKEYLEMVYEIENKDKKADYVDVKEDKSKDEKTIKNKTDYDEGLLVKYYYCQKNQKKVSEINDSYLNMIKALPLKDLNISVIRTEDISLNNSWNNFTFSL
ncbi:hypothetical protein M9Y10_042059 [Tritrichomonas musculus]|uniref:Protein kinase domain-containing protein n=1 Tax=Tritrichomonas musculus TaxID=1915356 RepID=A0ABR2K989_9EUKA